MKVFACPKCGKLVSARFPMHSCINAKQRLAKRNRKRNLKAVTGK